MANEQWEDVSQAAVKTAKLQVGASFSGTVVSIDTSLKYPEKKTLTMTDANGAQVLVFPSGNLNYAVADGDIEVGQTYKFTRLEDTKTPSGAARTKFRIQRLKADGTAAAPTTNAEKPAGKAK